MFKALYGPLLYPKADRLGTYAAALAYCVVLSLVPFLAVTFAVGVELSSRFDINKHYAEHYADVVSEILPTEDPHDTERIFAAVQHSTQGGLVTIGFILAIYTSFNLMDQIARTLLFIFDDPKKPREFSFKSILKTFALLFIWMCLLLMISVSAVETSILRNILDTFILSDWSKEVARATQALFIIGALFVTFSLTYYLVPSRSYKTRFILEGSILATCGWVVCSLIFAYIIPKLLQTSAAYIALGSIVAILLWAQACAWSVIVGACWVVRFSPRTK
jgi:membrane protein